MKRKSQKSRILKYLLSGKKITPMIAYEKFGCLRLSERIREIQDDIKWQIMAATMKELRDHPIKVIKKGWKQVNKYTRVREYWL